MKIGKRLTEFLILIAVLCLIVPAVQAADVSVGGGIGFAPDYEGSKDVGINLGANWVINQNWSARGVASYTQLLGDASDDSPVVDEGSEGQLFSAVMAVYSF